MRLLCFLAFAMSFAAGLPAHASELVSPASLSVRVMPGDWGRVKVAEIEKVLAFVANTLVEDFPGHSNDRIIVRHGTRGPQALFERSMGDAYRIVLDVQDARWDQFAYQFSHELCHVFTNFQHRSTSEAGVIRDHQWFEESLCEAVSLIGLERVAERWGKSAPYAGWEDYAPAFREYSNRLRSQTHRVLPGGDIGRWLSAYGRELERDPYARDRNELIATWLLPLLQATPGSLKALAYLNAEPLRGQSDFAAYLDGWLNCCPEADRGFVREVISLLSRRVPGAT